MIRMKILITGGHITPALAVIDELKKDTSINIVVVGRDHSFESRSVQNKNISFIPINPGRFTRIISLKSIMNVLQFPIGIIRAMSIVSKENPDKILCFGGYIALPVAIAGWLFQIPVYTHEQTLIPGITNKFISNFAKKTFISFPESASYFKRTTMVTGNPLRKEVLKIREKIVEFKKNKPVIYVTGGSLGAHSLNIHIEHILPELLKKYYVIHQTGDVTEFQDFQRLSSIKNENYYVFKHVLENQLGYIYSCADIVVCRSGANTIMELIALKKPAVLVPLPWSAHKEQDAQAKLLEKQGAAEIFMQRENSLKLYECIEQIYDKREEYKKNYSKLISYYHPEAAAVIAHEIIS